MSKFLGSWDRWMINYKKVHKTTPGVAYETPTIALSNVYV